MAKRADSVVGIDLGKHLLKGVALRRKNDSRFILTSFASRPVPEEFDSAEDLSRELKQLLCDLGGSAKACAFAVSDPSTILRIIEQPDTPVDLLRNALRLNGLAVLNQECKDFVRVSAEMLQLAPVCSFNAFEFAYPEIFANDAFLLLDTGHLRSTVLIGSRSELVLVRSIDYGGKALMQALTAEDALDADAAWLMVQQGDEGMTEICRGSLARLGTEVRNSIGFFEGQCEEGINRIFVSGGLARAETVLQALSDDLSLPCEIWDPLETCEVALPAAKRQALPNEFVSLNVACGAAFEYFKT